MDQSLVVVAGILPLIICHNSILPLVDALLSRTVEASSPQIWVNDVAI